MRLAASCSRWIPPEPSNYPLSHSYFQRLNIFSTFAIPQRLTRVRNKNILSSISAVSDMGRPDEMWHS
jgi:hypothetical protein